jgi:hypothetical protein
MSTMKPNTMVKRNRIFYIYTEDHILRAKAVVIVASMNLAPHAVIGTVGCNMLQSMVHTIFDIYSDLLASLIQ